MLIITVKKKQNTENNKCWRGRREIRIPVRHWWECKMVQLLWETVWKNLQNIKNRITV